MRIISENIQEELPDGCNYFFRMFAHKAQESYGCDGGDGGDGGGDDDGGHDRDVDGCGYGGDE